jgi:hypothetical protein
MKLGLALYNLTDRRHRQLRFAETGQGRAEGGEKRGGWWLERSPAHFFFHRHLGLPSEDAMRCLCVPTKIKSTETAVWSYTAPKINVTVLKQVLQ